MKTDDELLASCQDLYSTLQENAHPTTIIRFLESSPSVLVGTKVLLKFHRAYQEYLKREGGEER
jgi:GTPase SAR1 family protein